MNTAKLNNAVKNRIFASRFLHDKAEHHSTQLSAIAHGNDVLGVVFIKLFPLDLIERLNPSESEALPFIRSQYDLYREMNLDEAIQTCSKRPPNKALANMLEALVGAVHVDANEYVYEKEDFKAWQDETQAHRAANAVLDQACLIDTFLARHQDPSQTVASHKQRFHELIAKRVCDVEM